MKKTSLPRRRYGTDDFPLIDEGAIGRVIPIGYGAYAGLEPTQINAYTRRYKIVDQAIATITRIASETKDPLIKDTDYFEFLAVGEFRLNYQAKLIVGTTYYFSIQADYSINGTNFIGMGQNYDLYEDGVSYEVSAAGAWTPTINALRFQLWGRPDPLGAEASIVQNTVDDEETSALNLRDAATRTKVGQSFKPISFPGTAVDTSGDTNGSTAIITGMADTSDFNVGEYVTVSAGFPTTGPYKILSKSASSLTLDENSNSAQSNITVTAAVMAAYPSKIHFYGITKTVTPPTGNIWVTIYETVDPEYIIHVLSEEKTVSQITGGEIELAFNDPGDIGSEFVCDVELQNPAMTQVADILPDVIENIMGKNPAILDAAELANLAADRTQPLEIFFREEIEFGDFVGKLEAGQLWKFIPKQDGTYMTVVPEAGEPGNLLSVREHQILSFKMEINSAEIRQVFNVFYAEDPTVGDYSAVQKTSDVARFFYMNEQSRDVETYLRDLADGDALALAYLARYEVPIVTVILEIHGWALNLVPFRDKIKVWRSRGAYAGGLLDGVLFRITKLVKKPETNVVEITASIWGNSAT